MSQATPFTGGSPSSTPVTWFWNAAKTSAAGAITSVRANARGTQSTGVAFGGSGESIALGSLEEFREINVTISKAASAGYTGIWEYVSAVDAAGRPASGVDQHDRSALAVFIDERGAAGDTAQRLKRAVAGKKCAVRFGRKEDGEKRLWGSDFSGVTSSAEHENTDSEKEWRAVHFLCSSFLNVSSTLFKPPW